MRRKRFQRGCLKPRRRNGRNYWYAQWREDGKPKSKELGLCAKVNRAEAEAMLSSILHPVNVAAGHPSSIVYTLAKFIEEVYLPVCQSKWKSSTLVTEGHRLKLHVVGSLGSLRIEEITREDMQSFLDQKAKVLAQTGIDHLRFRLRSIFELAMSEGVVDRNPAIALFTPRVCLPDRERLVLTSDQASTMIEALDLREKLLARLATWEGMRPGEILALQIGDVATESVWVRRRLYRFEIDTPKTKRSIRQVALTKATSLILAAWVEAMPSRDPAAWLFGSENRDKPISRDNVWNRCMYPKLKPVGLEWATFQVMRRTFATLSKQAGVDAHTRSAQMGNTVNVNENEYAVSKFEDRLAAVRLLESTLVQ